MGTFILLVRTFPFLIDRFPSRVDQNPSRTDTLPSRPRRFPFLVYQNLSWAGTLSSRTDQRASSVGGFLEIAQRFRNINTSLYLSVAGWHGLAAGVHYPEGSDEQ